MSGGHDEVAGHGARRRAAHGVLILLVRSGVGQLITLAGSVVLLRVLTPAEMGVFAVLSFALAFFQLFGDAGLAGALVQSKEAPTEAGLRTTFTVHAALALLVVALVWVLAPEVVRVWPKLPAGSDRLLRAMSLSFLLTMVRIVPSVLLERELRFGVFAVADVMQLVAFYAVAVGCALGGLLEWLWPAAVIAQALAGTVVIVAARPWRPRFGVDRALLRSMIGYGLPFQAKNFIGFANGAVTPLYAGATLGPAAVGLIGWGQQMAFLPLRVVEAVARVTFPFYAKLQYDRPALARSVERSIQVSAFVVFFSSALLLTSGATITRVVFSEKWLPGLLALQASAAVLVIGFLSPLIGAALDAVGRPGIIARLAAGWTLLNWIAVPLATWRWGFAGFVLGYCVHVVVGNLAAIWVLARQLPEVRLWEPLRAPALAALGAAAVGWLLVRPLGTTPWALVVTVAAAFAVHLAIFAAADPQAIAIARDLLLRRRAGAAGSGDVT